MLSILKAGLPNIAEAFQEQFFVPAHVHGDARAAWVREKIAEAVGSILGMGGAVWLALRIDGFSYAYIPFLLSSMVLVRHFCHKKQGWMMIQQMAFTVINISGIYSWIYLSPKGAIC